MIIVYNDPNKEARGKGLGIKVRIITFNLIFRAGFVMKTWLYWAAPASADELDLLREPENKKAPEVWSQLQVGAAATLSRGARGRGRKGRGDEDEDGDGTSALLCQHWGWLNHFLR